jgi:hypothetical protein
MAEQYELDFENNLTNQREEINKEEINKEKTWNEHR